MRRLLLLLALAGAAAARPDGIDDAVRANMASDRTPGIAVAIIGPDRRADIRCYGTANLELGVKVTPDTVFRWASLSKQFTSMAIHLLVREGKVSLDASVCDYLKEAPAFWRPIKIVHLLSHTAGIPDPGPRFRIDQDYTSASYIAALAAEPLKWTPGDKYEYSNSGYALLGLVVSAASGVPFPDFVEQRILKPAGMKTARCIRDEEIVPNRADGYRLSSGELRGSKDERPWVYAGSGGLMGSIKDFVAWDLYLRKGGPGEDILTAMRTRAVLEGGKTSTYGRGWTIAKWGGSDMNIHGGTTYGFTCSMARDLTKGITVIVLRNISTGDAPGLARKIHDLAAAR